MPSGPLRPARWSRTCRCFCSASPSVLSMDYEVFLISRIREFWMDSDRGHPTTTECGVGVGPHRQSRHGCGIGDVHIPAALIAAQVSFMRMFGVGLTLAVLVDATWCAWSSTAFMHILGRWNWWAPGSPARPAAGSGSAGPNFRPDSSGRATAEFSSPPTTPTGPGLEWIYARPTGNRRKVCDNLIPTHLLRHERPRRGDNRDWLVHIRAMSREHPEPVSSPNSTSLRIRRRPRRWAWDVVGLCRQRKVRPIDLHVSGLAQWRR